MPAMLRRLAGLLVLLGGVLAAAPAPASADVVWLCRPGLAADPCTAARDTTVRVPGRPDRVVTPRTGRREIDCFYVYPTVSNQPTGNATKARDPELASIARFQAARFGSVCRVFAPVYRQVTLRALANAATTPVDTARAYGDVREAWRAYRRRYAGRRRGVVLLGHSQGTRWLRQLVREEIEPDRAQRRRLVGAVLLGGDVTVAAGRTTGGDFRSIPLCTRRAQLGCVVAFSTFAQDPPPEPRFGRPVPAAPGEAPPGGAGLRIACTDPRRLAGWTGPLRILTPSAPFAPGPIAAGIAATAGGAAPTAPTTWIAGPDRFTARCRSYPGATTVLRLEPVAPSRRPAPFPDPTWGTHLIDVNVALEPLVSLVGQQARRYARRR